MDRTRAAAPATITRALQVSELADGLTSVVWTADFLPDDIGGFLSKAIEAGMAAMQRSLDRLAA